MSCIYPEPGHVCSHAAVSIPPGACDGHNTSSTHDGARWPEEELVEKRRHKRAREGANPEDPLVSEDAGHHCRPEGAGSWKQQNEQRSVSTFFGWCGAERGTCVTCCHARCCEHRQDATVTMA